MTHSTVRMNLDMMQIPYFHVLSKLFVEGKTDPGEDSALGELIVPKGGWMKDDGNLYSTFKNITISRSDIQNALFACNRKRGASEFNWRFEVRGEEDEAADRGSEFEFATAYVEVKEKGSEITDKELLELTRKAILRAIEDDFDPSHFAALIKLHQHLVTL